MKIDHRDNTTLSPEEMQAKAERGPLYWRFTWSAALITGIIVVATAIAQWAGHASVR